MNHDESIQEELLELNSSLAKLSRISLLSVPEGFFEQFPLQVWQTLLSESLDQKTSIPQDYFEDLSHNILSKIKSEEEDEQGFLSQRAKISTPYLAPEDYFEQFAISIPKEAAVIRMSQNRKVFLYAVAAAIVGLLGFSLYSKFTLPLNQPKDSGTAVLHEANKIINEGSFERNLESLSDESIVHYLQSNGQDVSAALVASVIDESKLPDATDYLFDEQVLENVLSELDLSANKQL